MTDQSNESYLQAGYSNRRIGFGERPAILVVDLHVAFTDPKYVFGRLPMLQKATDNTAELLKVARAKGVPVASCYTAYCGPGDMPHWKVADVVDHFYYGDPSNAMDPRIYDPEHDFNFCKNAPSMFFNTPLTTFLVKQQIDTTIITGCTTSGCVRATTVDAFSHGFRVIIPEECVGDADEVPHRQNLSDVDRRYADVTTMAEVLEYLGALPVSAAA
jgi:maleamate amidohydrolase